MLRELRIKNLAIIDDLKVRFEDGFNVLTGETGAGKSIIVDSLGLVLGSRAQSDLVRTGEKEAVVQAFFDVETKSLPVDSDIDISDGLIIRRSVSSSGKSRAYVNDTMVSLQSLAEIGRALVDIHGQHEHQSLFSTDNHRFFLDSFGNLHDEREKVSALYGKVGILSSEKAALQEKMKERSHRVDLLRFQLNEIDTAYLKAGEKETLNEERKILSNLTRLNELAGTAYSLIYGAEGSCQEKLSSLISKVKEMSSIDNSASDTLNMLESARPLIEDAAVALRGFRDKYDLEPERIAEVEDRLELIKKLERKYGEGFESIIKYRTGAEEELNKLELADERLDAIEEELKAEEDMLINYAHALSERRKSIAGKLEELIKNELRDLAFSNIDFRIDIKKDLLTSHGMDKVEFLFSANPGEPPKPLVKIASGGELSRVMLALKSILADFDRRPVLIFDEVDAGIGGKTAVSVGKKLKALSDTHQVLCTTHLPQIASMGDFHLKIEKGQKDEKTHVAVKELEGKDRLNEIARMLGGNVTEVSLKHAKELLEGHS